MTQKGRFLFVIHHLGVILTLCTLDALVTFILCLKLCTDEVCIIVNNQCIIHIMIILFVHGGWLSALEGQKCIVSVIFLDFYWICIRKLGGCVLDNYWSLEALEPCQTHCKAFKIEN